MIRDNDSLLVRLLKFYLTGVFSIYVFHLCNTAPMSIFREQVFHISYYLKKFLEFSSNFFGNLQISSLLLPYSRLFYTLEHMNIDNVFFILINFYP